VADWPQFRGPSEQGLVPDDVKLPLTWSDKEHVVWNTAIPGSDWSSPVVSQGKIYLTTAVSEGGSNDDPPTKDRSLRALCLDAASGKILWDNEVLLAKGRRRQPDPQEEQPRLPHPVLSGGKLFVHFGTHGTACLDLDGKLVWKVDTIHYSPVHGNGGSPVVVDNKLIFACDGPPDPFVVALDTATGQQVWKTPRKTEAKKLFSFCTPLLIGNGIDRELIIPGSGNLYA